MSRMDTAPAQASRPGERPPARRAAAWFAVTLAGSALLGLLAGLIWGAAAPRALVREVGGGTAQLVNAETTAFIAADAWFCAIAAVTGLLTGLVGYRFASARRDDAAGPACAAGLILGAVAGSFLMLWAGERIGLSGYDQHLAASPKGTLFLAPLALGAKTALAFWPMVTAVVILVTEWGTRPARDPGAPGAPGAPAEPSEFDA
jgi:hypothetical protein